MIANVVPIFAKSFSFYRSEKPWDNHYNVVLVCILTCLAGEKDTVEGQCPWGCTFPQVRG